MPEVPERRAITTGQRANGAVLRFFDAYRRQDVEGMVDACVDNANFRYVPAEVMRKQRVIRGDGKVRGVGKTWWSSLIDAFPDLTNDVQWIGNDDEGNVAVEVTISGTQAKAFGTLANSGMHYDLAHLFLFHVNREGLIDDIVAYWDTADWYRQLGRLECD
ncbi:nuclear transport factor 2 family protein [Paraburkholderia sp. CNPSo 3274]|uniref:nuclear transport factor 2 family protein n=1 Tax=Paraburkholderia sp. CNPSo 3274 TaxID=2940932 RepID=UPI0020B72D60|nr:nuclear transport factor 2 family protein [Paraburkholderia sp. CNPSo 3274]MCP3709305.1 nuclear transport factor 2 family protein [Paraburkholderia sp. CNPSo 3274]